jgi:hypothetical protein
MRRSFPSAERGRMSHLAVLMFSTMYRRGTVAATDVAGLPQAIRCGTLTQPTFRQRVQNGTDIRCPNLRFASYRAFQLPSRHHTSARRIVPRLAMTPNRTPRKWHGNWIIPPTEASSSFSRTTHLVYSEIRGTRISSVMGDYERAR